MELLHLPGHTPGTMGMVVRTETFGTAVFPSDAVYNALNYGLLPCFRGCAPGRRSLAVALKHAENWQNGKRGLFFSAMTWQVIRRIRNRRNGMYDVA